MTRTATYARLALSRKRNTAPAYLIHHVTDRCNAKCRHCFIVHDGAYAIPDGVTHGDVLTLQEIERLTKTLGPNLYTVQLTGGEPLLRADLLGIIRAYYASSAVSYVQVCSNGWFTQRSAALAEAVLTEDPRRRFGFVISVDDVEARHDENRKMAGLFEALVGTIRALQELQKSFEGLQVSVNVTVTKHNQDRLHEIYTYLTSKLGIQNVMSTLIRGTPADPNAGGVDIDKYEAFVEACADGWMRGQYRGFGNFLEARLVNAQNVLTRRRNVALARDPTEHNVCYAGDLSGVVYADGTVAFCEEVPLVVGNLRDWDFDFTALWRSDLAARVRARRDATPCKCTHECFAVCNTLFNPRNWPRLALIAARGPHGDA
ncbi:radical SAM protein [Tenggerimyces flavus]|uniref:Radical SAM protein n=1 Tax=Tenggerimyces flavus TaxID=1708749 RepID=A0ABV7YJ76_9ACTN|nr:radical SAM protein [Tenggerimyces flavus]MBM7789574.1 MoaA/NifB/PqqE/SkfB family radical SAM enzyme [Tenggerimyces flavus]